MPDINSPHDSPFDLDKLLAIVDLMEKHGLTEVSLQRGDEKWKVRRGPEGNAQFAAVAVPTPLVAAAAGQAPAMPAAGAPAARENDGSITINSPTVGTFYSSPTPDDPPFVSVGSRVEAETVVCIVEAMKVFNQIPAEVSGTIIEVLAKNGDSVEFGQPLYRVRPG